MLYHRRVSKQVANNPIARAVAHKKLAEAILDQKIKLYIMEAGEECADVMEGIGMTLAVIGYASEIDPAIGGDSPVVRVLRGGLSACQQMIHRDFWDIRQAPAIEVALDAAESLNRRVKSEYVNVAYNKLVAK